jgi:nucleotide-binding universal stress UspA family protein
MAAQDGDHDAMPTASHETNPSGPALLCFDGSEGAAYAIAQAGHVLRVAAAMVLTVWEPVALWQPYDPATILTSPLARLANSALGLDEIASDLAREKMERGVTLARAAGFKASERVAEGKSWRTICDVAEEIDASTIVLGARGLSRVGSMLLGSVSSAVSVHARRPVLIVPQHGS